MSGICIKCKWMKIALCILIILIISCYFIFQNLNQMFTTECWMNYRDIRYEMIDDMEKNHPLIGKTQQEVKTQLGEPDIIYQKDSLDNFAYVYNIGRERTVFSIMDESDIYVIGFQDGIVMGTSVQPG